MKFKVFALDFDSSNADDVAFVNKTIKDLFSSSETDDCTVTEVTASATVEKPADAPKTTRAPRKPKVVQEQPVEVTQTVEDAQPVEVTQTVEDAQPVDDLPFSEETKEPTSKEMQDLVIGLIKAGTLTREDVQNIFQEFGGTSLSKIPSSKFVLLKQRLTTYNG